MSKLSLANLSEKLDSEPIRKGFGRRYPIYAAQGLSGLSILATAALLPRARPNPAEDGSGPAGRRLALLSWGRYAEYFARPELSSLLYQFFAFSFAFATFTSGFALFAERQLTWDGRPFGAKHVGYVFAYAGFLGIMLQGGLIGRLVKRFGEARLARAGFATMAVGYGLLGFVRRVPERRVMRGRHEERDVDVAEHVRVTGGIELEGNAERFDDVRASAAARDRSIAVFGDVHSARREDDRRRGRDVDGVGAVSAGAARIGDDVEPVIDAAHHRTKRLGGRADRFRRFTT